MLTLVQCTLEFARAEASDFVIASGGVSSFEIQVARSQLALAESSWLAI